MIIIVVTRLVVLIMVSQNAARAKSAPRVILGSRGVVGWKGGREATSGAHSNTVRHLVPGPPVIPFLRDTRRSFLSAAIFCLISFIHSSVLINLSCGIPIKL